MVERLPPSDDFVNEVVLVHAPGRDVATDAAVSRRSRLWSRAPVDGARGPRRCPTRPTHRALDRDGPGRRGRDQGRARGRRASRRRPVRGDDHGRVHRRQRLPRALQQGSEGRALLRPARGAARPARRLRRGRRLVRPGAARDRRDRARAWRSSRSMGQIWEVSFFIVNMLTGMGLALGRRLRPLHRLPLPRGRAGTEKLDAISATGRTASRAVLFSGSAFVIALTGMLLVPDTILQPRARRRPRRHHGRACGDHAAAGRARPARRQGERRAAAVRRALRRGRRAVLGPSWPVQQRPLVSLVVSGAVLVAPARARSAHRSAGVRTVPTRIPPSAASSRSSASSASAPSTPAGIVVDGD